MSLGENRIVIIFWPSFCPHRIEGECWENSRHLSCPNPKAFPAYCRLPKEGKNENQKLYIGSSD